MAYSVKLTKPVCERCGRPATYEVFNRVNATLGYYCARHAPQAVHEANKREVEP